MKRFLLIFERINVGIACDSVFEDGGGVFYFSKISFVVIFMMVVLDRFEESIIID